MVERGELSWEALSRNWIGEFSLTTLLGNYLWKFAWTFISQSSLGKCFWKTILDWILENSRKRVLSSSLGKLLGRPSWETDLGVSLGSSLGKRFLGNPYWQVLLKFALGSFLEHRYWGTIGRTSLGSLSLSKLSRKALLAHYLGNSLGRLSCKFVWKVLVAKNLGKLSVKCLLRRHPWNSCFEKLSWNILLSNPM